MVGASTYACMRRDASFEAPETWLSTEPALMGIMTETWIATTLPPLAIALPRQVRPRATGRAGRSSA